MKRYLFKIIVIVVLSASTVYAGDLYTTKSGHLAAIYLDDLDRALSYRADGDIEAIKTLAASNRVFILKPGLKVFLVDVKMFSGVVKIRLQGMDFEVWTTLEAIEK